MKHSSFIDNSRQYPKSSERPMCQ